MYSPSRNAVIPYTRVFLQDPSKPGYVLLHAQVTSIRPLHFRGPFRIWGSRSLILHWVHISLLLTYGDHRRQRRKPKPCLLVVQSEGCPWLKAKQKVIAAAPTILVVGGRRTWDLWVFYSVQNACFQYFLEFATDIKGAYTAKKITLLHSVYSFFPSSTRRCMKKMSVSASILTIHPSLQYL